MEIRTLKYFVAVADLLNFSQAAKSLYVSQSTLSQQILDLEKELGTPLLERKNRTTSLTPAGKVLLVEAKELLYRMEKMQNDVRDAKPNQMLNLSLVVGFQATHMDNVTVRHAMASSAAELRDRHPGIAITFRRYDGSNPQDQLLIKGFDVCMVSGHHELDAQRIGRRVIWEDEMLLSFHKRFPRPETLDELRDFLSKQTVYMLSDNIDGMAYTMGLFSELSVSPPIRFHDDPYRILLAAESGEGIMITPRSTCEQIRSLDLQSVPFYGTDPVLRTSVIWREDSDNPMIGEFCDLLCRQLAIDEQPEE